MELLKKDRRNPEALKALKDHADKMACQAIGIVLRGEKKVILNFLPEPTLGRASFYLSPLFYFDLHWPTGSVLCDLDKQKVIWVDQP